MHQLQRSWVRSQHPSAQWNLRGGRWNSAEYRTKKNPPKKYFKQKILLFQILIIFPLFPLVLFFYCNSNSFPFQCFLSWWPLRSKYYDKKRKKEIDRGKRWRHGQGCTSGYRWKPDYRQSNFMQYTKSIAECFNSSSSLMIIYKFIKNILVLFSSEDRLYKKIISVCAHS